MIKRNCIFLLDKEKDKPDAKLRYRIKWNGNTVAFNVGFRIDIDKWSTEAQRCKNNTTHGKKKIHSSVINREIARFEQMAEQVFYAYEQRNATPTAEQFREEFNKLNGKSESHEKSFFECYNEFIIEQSRENHWTEATIKKHTTVKRHLETFAPKLQFSDLTEKGLNAFMDYLLSDAALKNTTATKDFMILKWFLKWATQKGYNLEPAFQSFKPKLKIIDKQIIFLDWEELMKVYNYPIPSDKTALIHTRNIFCFCCFTGLRYSDVRNLKKTNVFENYIQVTTQKTYELLKIELNKYAKAILEMYKNSHLPDDRIFPVQANQKMNERMKELGELCGINTPMSIVYYRGSERIEETLPKWKLLSTHAGRRTFICNALMLGIAPNIVMKWTGHANYSAMKPYIEIADKAKEDAMNLFNK